MHITKFESSKELFSVSVPSSKSMANRALVLASLSVGRSAVHGDFEAEDIQVLIQGLQACGVDIQFVPDGLVLQPSEDWRTRGADVDMYLGNAGTAVRFATALMAIREGRTTLHGKERMHERPIGLLVDALRDLGSNIKYTEKEGFPPLLITGSKSLEGGSVTIDGGVSSQFLSAVLMIGPLLKNGVDLTVSGEFVSRPYVEMTIRQMEEFGATVEKKGDNCFIVHPGGCEARDYEVEGDASAASYWFCAGALLGKQFCVTNVCMDSLQGDVKFVEVLKEMGCEISSSDGGICVQCTGRLNGIDVDMNAMPDMVMSLAVCAAVANGETMIRNIGNLRVKETDRIAAIAKELSKLGVQVEEGPDFLRIVGRPDLKVNAVTDIETYDDHRMAMSFAILGLRTGNLNILGDECVRKSYPGFWGDIKRTVYN